MNIAQLQKDYDEVTKKISELKKAQLKIKNEGVRNGLMLKGSTFVEDKKVFGIFYDLAYYSHFDGHRSGAVNEYAEGACVAPEGAFEYIKKLIETGVFEGEETLFEHLEGIPFDDCGYLEIPGSEFSKSEQESFLKHFKIVSPTEITWEYKGSQDQGEYRDGSGFTIKEATLSAIKAVKSKSYTETD